MYALNHIGVAFLRNALFLFFKSIVGSLIDLLPIIFVIGFFQVFVIQQSIPGFFDIIIGVVFIVFGLTFFIFGLNMGLFPIGESMANAFAKQGNIAWLLIFSFCLGVGATIAEPALIVVVHEASKIVAQAGIIQQTPEAMHKYAEGMRLTVACSVGFALTIGVFRIIKGWSIQYMIIGGYILVVLMTMIAPKEIIGIAYDLGGVTTSTITVPLVTALGVGLASSIKGRNPMTDGFGLIALSALAPIFFVMIYGMVI